MGDEPQNSQNNKLDEHQESLAKDTLSQHALDEAELKSVAGGKQPVTGGIELYACTVDVNPPRCSYVEKVFNSK